MDFEPSPAGYFRGGVSKVIPGGRSWGGIGTHYIVSCRVLWSFSIPASWGGSSSLDYYRYHMGFSSVHAVAAKSLWSGPTLCDPADGSPPGSAVPGILQARTLEWVAMPFPIYIHIYIKSHLTSFPGGASGKEFTSNAGGLRDAGLISGLRTRSPRGGHGTPSQHSCPENPVHRGTWRATVHGVAKTQTRPND